MNKLGVSHKLQKCANSYSAFFRSAQPSAATLLSDAVSELTTHGIATPRLDAEVLLAHALGTDRAGLYARLHTPLPSGQVRTFRQLISRRTHSEPLQYITGVQEFWSLNFKVDRRVLIPRPETEVVVEVALQLLERESSPSGEKGIPPRLLDIGTGSGCIAIALATELPQAEIWASDISPAALAVAINNAQCHGVAERITFLHGDLLAPVAKEAHGFHLIAANLPYIARPELVTLQPEVRDWEPRPALDGGLDGLDFYRRLLDECPAALRPGGWVVLEIGQGQSEQVMRLAGAQQDLTECRCVADYAGYPRVVVAHRV